MMAPPMPKNPEQLPPIAPTAAANGQGKAAIARGCAPNVRRARSKPIASKKIENATRSVALGSNRCDARGNVRDRQRGEGERRGQAPIQRCFARVTPQADRDVRQRHRDRRPLRRLLGEPEKNSQDGNG